MKRRHRRHSPRRSYGDSLKHQWGMFWPVVGASVVGIIAAELIMQVFQIKRGSMSGFGMATRPVRMPGGTRTGLPFFPTPD